MTHPAASRFSDFPKSARSSEYRDLCMPGELARLSLQVLGEVRNWTVPARWQSVWAFGLLMVSHARVDSNAGSARVGIGRRTGITLLSTLRGLGQSVRGSHSGHTDNSHTSQFQTSR